MNALEQDVYQERRRKWRRSGFWRGILVAAIVAAIVAAFVMFDDDYAQPHIARFAIEGVIEDDLERDFVLREIAEDERVEAVILRINSPGGSTAGAEALLNSLRRISEEKPVVATLREVAASGGYVAALGADHIIALGNTLTGSIGVILEYPDVTEAMDHLGVDMETFRSSDLKAEPSPFRPISPEGRAEAQRMVAESFDWFRELVQTQRNLDGEEIAKVATGGVFSGREAMEFGLVDEIGGEDEARAWLESRSAELADLPIVNWEVPSDDPGFGTFFGKSLIPEGLIRMFSRSLGPKLYSIYR